MDFGVTRREINIFPEVISPEMVDGIEDGEKVVFISIGPGETHINVVDNEGGALASWTAVFGWSNLCKLPISHKDALIYPTDRSMITKALRSSLRLYGEQVSTEAFISSAKSHLRYGISHIVDATIGDAKSYDRIVLAAPAWLHEALEDCLDIRPHINPEIQDL